MFNDYDDDNDGENKPMRITAAVVCFASTSRKQTWFGKTMSYLTVQPGDRALWAPWWAEKHLRVWLMLRWMRSNTTQEHIRFHSFCQELEPKATGSTRLDIWRTGNNHVSSCMVPCWRTREQLEGCRKDHGAMLYHPASITCLRTCSKHQAIQDLIDGMSTYMDSPDKILSFVMDYEAQNLHRKTLQGQFGAELKEMARKSDKFNWSDSEWFNKTFDFHQAVPHLGKTEVLCQIPIPNPWPSGFCSFLSIVGLVNSYSFSNFMIICFRKSLL